MTPKQSKKNYTLIIWLILLVGIASTILYAVWDNNRVIVVKQEVAIQGLPASFEGYNILVLSDLHGKSFGSSQANLLSQINSLDYDAVFIAGDMQDRDATGCQPLIEILHGLKKNTPIYFVAGNWGPFDFDPATGKLLDAGQVLQTEGVILLPHPIKVELNGEHIWIVPDFSYSKNAQLLEESLQYLSPSSNKLTSNYYSRIFEYQFLLLGEISVLPEEDVVIGMTHIPLPKEALNDLSDHPPYDLILAGHYHGGQIRLPLIGAFYVPDHHTLQNSFFPDNQYISGLYVGKASQQFISRGLGATGIIPLLKFRLFNPPEIDLITLKPLENP